TGVGDAGHAAVGHQRHLRSGLGGGDQLWRTSDLVAFEVGDHGAGDGDAQVPGQAHQAAGVLGRHQIGGGERLPEPAGGVGRVAQRRSEKHDPTFHRPPPPAATTVSAAYDDRVTLTEAAPQPTRAAVPEVVRRRLAPPAAKDRWWSWVATGVVTAIAAIIRLVALDRPGHIIFDEVYYAPNAYALTRYGVEWHVPENGAHPVDGA